MTLRRLVLGSLAWLCVLVAVLVLCGASAFAAAPEAPSVEVSSRKATEVKLRGVLYPGAAGEAGSYEFLYKQSASECKGGSKGPAGVATGNQGEEVLETLSGLEAGRQYTVCLAVSNGSETTLSAPVTVATLPAAAPVVEESSVTHVSASSATLAATIDPQGAETSYAFEDTPAGGAFAPVPGAEGKGIIPDGSKGVPVSVHVQGLLAHTAYQFRVVAVNSVGAVTGAPGQFTTQPLGVVSGLADGRSWEMVSPLQKEGVQFNWLGRGGGVIQASAGGDAFIDGSFYEPIEATAAGSYDVLESNFFGRGQSGWVAKTISPPHSAAGLAGSLNDYWFFSEDLSKAILRPIGPVTPLAPGVSESTPYVRTNYLDGSPSELCGSGCYEPLVSEANVPTGTRYGGAKEEQGVCLEICGPTVLGVSRDLSHVVLGSKVALTAGLGAAPDPRVGNGLRPSEWLYEWSGGKLTFLGSGELAGDGGTFQLVRHAISNDGSRIIVVGSYEGVKGLLLRDTATGETIRLDASQGGLPQAPPGGASFAIASSDGSRVFFLSGPPLTEGASSDSLYEYDQNAPAGSRLTDLSVVRNPGEEPGAGQVLGASEDGSYVYFVATGVLAEGATPAGCSGGTQTCENLYVSHDGQTKFVIGLDAAEGSDWGELAPTTMTSRVSPNGQWLEFMSNRNLTGYDTRDAVSGHLDEEVYLYNASTGKLVCASCNPTGARPVGVYKTGSPEDSLKLITGEGFEATAASVPPWNEYAGESSDYQSRYLSDSGRSFFDSSDALVPQDVNGTQDVYEYEPVGVGDCDSSQVTFSGTSDGCLSLVSSGESSDESAFLDASETGGDVFFLTTSRLVSQDFDNAYDIYDARECGTGGARCFASAPVTAPPCGTSDSCKPAPSPQPVVFGSPASATFSGAGNVRPQTGPPVVKPKGLTRAQRLTRALRVCHREQGKRRRSCERQAHARYGRGSGRANATKRSGR
jgi:hypothetical protein